jgi:hypothetical protein
MAVAQVKGFASDKDSDSYFMVFFTEIAVFGAASLSSMGHTDIVVAQLGGKVPWASATGEPGNDKSMALIPNAAGEKCVTRWFSKMGTVSVRLPTPA